MVKGNEEIKEIELTELQNISTFDLSSGFVCDTETGLCGPSTEINKEHVEENENENNDMV